MGRRGVSRQRTPVWQSSCVALPAAARLQAEDQQERRRLEVLGSNPASPRVTRGGGAEMGRVRAPRGCPNPTTKVLTYNR